MIAFLSWYLLLTFLGLLAFPLAFRLFPALPDRGYSLARAFGLLIWGYVFWIFGSLGIAQNDAGGLLLALAIPAALTAVGWTKLAATDPASTSSSRLSVLAWMRANRRYVLTLELLFLVSFACLALVRAASPELTSAEKPMELAFISAILRSPGFPPADPWLSGYAISYYYFGYVMTAMLARVTSVPSSMAHNLMTALVFALGAAGSFGILYNLLTAAGAGHEEPDLPRRRAFLAPFFLLIVSNVEGLFEVLYRRAALPAEFWRWLDIRELTDPPVALPGGLFERLGFWWTSQRAAGLAHWFSSGIDQWFREQFMPLRYLWWWRASRVVQDYDLAGNHREVIDEFPFFSFLHADLHPHVLAIPFSLLAVAVGLHLLLGGWRGEFRILGMPIHITPEGFGVSAIVLGGLAFLNTWDVLVAAALILVAWLLARAAQLGWSWQRLEEALQLGLPLGLAAGVLYLPFYLGFSSQAGGILPNLINPTRGAHLWLMFAPLLLPVLAWMLYLWRIERQPAAWRSGIFLALDLILLLWLLSWLLAWFVQLVDPALAQSFLASQGLASLGDLFSAATARRLSNFGSVLTLFFILAPAVAFLVHTGRTSVTRDPQGSDDRQRGTLHFTLVLVLLAALLVLAPEFVYLRDQFGTRLNTVFKFYYQAWILWSLAAAYAVAVLLERLKGTWARVFRIAAALLLGAALIYPLLGLLYKTNYFSPHFGYSLDDFDRVQRENPDEAAAMDWLRRAPYGVVAEAVGDSYTGFGRVSAYSGLPTLLGWPGHESQWRGGAGPQGSRREDVTTLYTTPDWQTADAVLKAYDVRYVFFGALERSIPGAQEDKFRSHLRAVFEQGSTVVYAVPP